MSCEDVQALLEEGSRDKEVMAHVTACRVCAAHAALLTQLKGLAPRSEAQRAPWLFRLPHPSWLWQKPQTYLPLILGLGSLATGLGLSGLGKGLPAQEELGLLARTFWEVTGLSLGQALLTATGAIAAAWGPAVAVAAVGMGLLGAWLSFWVILKVRA